MSGSEPTQKQIAEKYKGNLGYFKKGHYLRRLRGWLFFLAVLGSIGGVLSFRYWGKEELLSTGPLSESHARFANHCAVCHEGAETDFLNALPMDEIRNKLAAFRGINIHSISAAVKDVPRIGLSEAKASLQKVGVDLSEDVAPEKILALLETGLSWTSLSTMDRACLKCHVPMGLHQPQSASIALKGALKELPLVHAAACTTCHREHVGHERMKLPTSQTCDSCHNNPQEYARTKDTLALAQSTPALSVTGENRNLGDGLIRFLVAADPNRSTAIESYVKGHPPFQYERAGARDPARLKYNHVRHGLADIPEVNGHKLTCTDCHQPGDGGAHTQKVSYEKHCQSCHSLHLTPDMPEIRIPHGDTEKVRDFLRSSSLTLHFAEALRARGVMDRMEIGKQLKEQFDNLAARGMSTAEELERRVFLLGDPPQEEARNSPRSNKTPFFPGCAKCHEMQKNGTGAPKVLATQIAERWVHHGPFTHLPHSHMDCTDCHGAANTSKLTSDILMPPQKLCAECHRSLEKDKLEHAEDTLKLRAELKPGSRMLADQQRKTGGVKEDCLSCHAFHAPPTATLLLQAHSSGK
jgi:predicted CXXCH cytochrome family protein